MDIGAVKTSIACVDEGLVLPETRYVVLTTVTTFSQFFYSMTLNMGGDDITEFLYVLLTCIKFPYRDIDLNHSYDWNVLEDLKSRLCTLADVGYCMRLLSDLSYRDIDRRCSQFVRLHCQEAK